VLNLAHEGHQGMVKTKRLLRSRVWFPGIDRAVESLVGGYEACQLNNGGNRADPLKPSEFPEKPWEKLAMEFMGL
jgi:hypothetical protein